MPMSILQITYYSYANIFTKSIEIDSAKKSSPKEKNLSETMLDIIDLLHAIAELLLFLNHSCNFFLYSLSGKTFRNQIKNFITNKFNQVKTFLKM
jgi:hypothetical protein